MKTTDMSWEKQDIRLWYAYHDGKCPNCGLDLKICHPLYNIYPHWSGVCANASAKGSKP